MTDSKRAWKRLCVSWCFASFLPECSFSTYAGLPPEVFSMYRHDQCQWTGASHDRICLLKLWCFQVQWIFVFGEKFPNCSLHVSSSRGKIVSIACTLGRREMLGQDWSVRFAFIFTWWLKDMLGRGILNTSLLVLSMGSPMVWSDYYEDFYSFYSVKIHFPVGIHQSYKQANNGYFGLHNPPYHRTI